MYSINHLYGINSIFNINAINHIEMYRGNIPVRYGNYVGSVSNFHIKMVICINSRQRCPLGIICQIFYCKDLC